MQREDALYNANILDAILDDLTWQELCTVARVCRTWNQIADAHAKWEEVCKAQAARTQDVPKRVGLGTNSTYETTVDAEAQPPALLPNKPASAKDRFRTFWKDRVCLGCLEAVLGGDIVRNRSQEKWDEYSAKEQEQGFPYPQAVKRWLCIEGIASLAMELYPTNNFLDMRGRALPAPTALAKAGKYAMKVIDENQGCCWWYVVFSPGDEDPPVYVCESQLPEGDSDSDEEAKEARLQDLDDMMLQNASFAHFWVDYLLEGLKWHESSNGEYLGAEVCSKLWTLHPWMPDRTAAATKEGDNAKDISSDNGDDD